MNEKIALFLKKIEGDEALAARFQGVKNPDEAYAIAASVQDGFTKEEFIAAMDAIRNNELSDADLESLAGGDADDVVGSILTSISTVSTISALAAI